MRWSFIFLINLILDAALNVNFDSPCHIFSNLKDRNVDLLQRTQLWFSLFNVNNFLKKRENWTTCEKYVYVNSKYKHSAPCSRSFSSGISNHKLIKQHIVLFKSLFHLKHGELPETCINEKKNNLFGTTSISIKAPVSSL